MRKVLFSVTLILFTAPLAAQEAESDFDYAEYIREQTLDAFNHTRWMKKENPNELGIDIVPSCDALSYEDSREIVESVLVRSRIRPVNNWEQYLFTGFLDTLSERSDIYLKVTYNCLATGTNQYAISVNVSFGFLVPNEASGGGFIYAASWRSWYRRAAPTRRQRRCRRRLRRRSPALLQPRRQPPRLRGRSNGTSSSKRRRPRAS